MQYRLPNRAAWRSHREKEQEELALAIGADGHLILEAIYNWATTQKLQGLDRVEILRQVWVQQ